jgi:hypothetical protein
MVYIEAASLRTFIISSMSVTAHPQFFRYSLFSRLHRSFGIVLSGAGILRQRFNVPFPLWRFWYVA